MIKYEIRLTVGNKRVHIPCETAGQMFDLYKDLFRVNMPEMYYNMGDEDSDEWIRVIAVEK